MDASFLLKYLMTSLFINIYYFPDKKRTFSHRIYSTMKVRSFDNLIKSIPNITSKERREFLSQITCREDFQDLVGAVRGIVSFKLYQVAVFIQQSNDKKLTNSHYLQSQRKV